MTIRDHLVYILQEVYSFHRDVLPLLDSLRHASTDERVRLTMQTEVDGIRGELDTAERALDLLGARFKMEHSPVGASLKEASERFRNQMAPTRSQQDVHVLLLVLTVAGIARSKYQAAREMALVVGEQDVAKLLDEMDQREVQGQADAGELMPQVIYEINGLEMRRAA